MAGRGTGGTAPGGRASGDPQLIEPVFCLNCFRALWIARNQTAQLLHSCIFLSQFEKRKTLLKLRCGALIAARVLVQHLVVVLDCRLKVISAVINFAQVKLGVPSQIMVRISLQELSELIS